MTGEYEELRDRGVSAFVQATGRDEYWHVLAEQRRSYLGTDGRARPELLETLPCAACGSADADEAFWKDGFRYVRCRDCGSLYVSPQLTQAHLDAYWEGSPVVQRWLEVLTAPAQLAFDRAKYEQALVRVEELQGGPGSVLDIGCSIGIFLDVALTRGWRAVGVEPGSAARARARERGLDVEADLASLDREAFDLVTFWEVVEHTKVPSAVLEAASSRMAADGVLLTLVGGNAHALANRVMRSASAAFDFSRLWYFSPASFARLLGRAGLEQVEYRSVLAELDTTVNYLRYGDPYAPTHDEEVLPADLLRELEATVLATDLGYKFLSLARRATARPGSAIRTADTN